MCSTLRLLNYRCFQIAQGEFGKKWLSVLLWQWAGRMLVCESLEVNIIVEGHSRPFFMVRAHRVTETLQVGLYRPRSKLVFCKLG